MVISLEPKTINLGQVSTLTIKREKFYFPNFRVFIGNYDEDFQLPEGAEAQYFDNTDSLASIVLTPETKGVKQIRGIIEEYIFVNKDSIDTYHYPFEIELQVL
jgi:hypothetical protein